MILQIFLLIIGLLLLVKGADWLVEGASNMAKKKNISDLAIGLTIVAFGTSAPELVVNVIASAQGYQDIVFGNIIGSNNFNLFMILGIAGLITPLMVQSSTVKKEIPFSFGAALLLFILANNFKGTPGFLTRFEGLFLLVIFGLFLLYVYKQLQNSPSTIVTYTSSLPTWKIWVFILLGLTLLIVGGRLVVSSGIEMATELGVSQTIIGLTIIAAGTSLPELATSVVAAVKKNNDIAIGNIIGSNIFNILFILGVSALIKPIGYNPIFNNDLYLLFGGTAFLFMILFFGKHTQLNRWHALLLLISYITYTLFLINKGT